VTSLGGIWAGLFRNKFPAKLQSPGGLLQAMNMDSKVLFHENTEFISMKTLNSLSTVQILEKCFEFKMMLDYLVPGLLVPIL